MATKGLIQALIGAVSVALLAGCGRAEPAFEFTYGIKQLNFTWPERTGATHYRLKENPDGLSGYTQVGADLTTTSYTHTIALYQRIDASYRLESCDSSICETPFKDIFLGDMAEGIGYFKASNTAANDNLGGAIALSGDGTTLAVGAVGEDSSATGIGGSESDNGAVDAGAVYLYVLSGGTWTQQAYIKASNTEAGDGFGGAVALSSDGNTLVVAAAAEDSSATGIGGSEIDNGAVDSGAVYVFSRSGTTWTQQAYIKASTVDAGDAFGTAVALSLDGNTLAVGAVGEDSLATGIGGSESDNGAVDSGAVYLFSRSGAIWTQQAYIKASTVDAGDAFGSAVALSGNGGNILAVGAIGEDSANTGVGAAEGDNSAAESGAVFLFSRSGATWSQYQYIKPTTVDSGDAFGTAVALNSTGTTLAVGATGEASASAGINVDQSDNSLSQAGAAYIFIDTSGTWSQQAYIKASNADAGDYFGHSVTLNNDGNFLAVGAWGEASSTIGVGGGETDNSITDAGAAYVYSRSVTTWSQKAYLKAPNTSGGRMGHSISISDDANTLAVGAPEEASSASGVLGNQSDSGAAGAGAVYLY